MESLKRPREEITSEEITSEEIVFLPKRNTIDIFSLIEDYEYNLKSIKREIKNETDLNSILIHAAEKNCLEVVKLLIIGGIVNINHQDKDGNTALLLSIQNSQDMANDADGDNDMINFLLEKGADINIKNKNGYNALLMGIKTINNMDAVKAVIAKGADINQQDEEGNTPLMLAIKCESEFMVELLIDYGVEVKLL